MGWDGGRERAKRLGRHHLGDEAGAPHPLPTLILARDGGAAQIPTDRWEGAIRLMSGMS